MDVPGSQDNLTERELPEKEQAPQAGSLFLVASGGDAGKATTPQSSWLLRLAALRPRAT